jgi:hypothetical protein
MAMAVQVASRIQRVMGESGTAADDGSSATVR